MLDQLFGAQLGTMAKFAVAFVLVLGLIGITALILRRFGSGGMPTSGGGRNRQPRLAVLDSAVVDSKRRLVLIRRDNSEHLLLIGGPSDVVVEANINRAGPVTSSAERRSRGIPPQDLDQFEYAPQPEPEMDMPAQYPAPRTPAPTPRQRDVAPRPQLRPQPEPDHFDDLPLAPVRPEPQAEPAAFSPPPPLPRPVAHPSASAPAPAQPRNEPNYSEMQQKMEAALRNPASPPAPRTIHAAPPPRPAAPPMPQTRPAPAVASPKSPPPPAPAQSRQDASNPFDSLEAEMASLLGQDKKS